ncbi:MAG: hypothetical protein NTY71_04760 [Methanoregula sp.]|nr:hypothetical protein [Methanoregula sp.]
MLTDGASHLFEELLCELAKLGVVVLEDPDCIIYMLDVHVKRLQPVRYVVVPEIIF